MEKLYNISNQNWNKSENSCLIFLVKTIAAHESDVGSTKVQPKSDDNNGAHWPVMESALEHQNQQHLVDWVLLGSWVDESIHDNNHIDLGPPLEWKQSPSANK